MTTLATSGRNCPRRTPRTGAETPGIAVLRTASLVSLKSSTRRSGSCTRVARTSSGPPPSTRTLVRCGACIIATREITDAVALAPAGSCVCASDGLAANATLANIRQPIRMAGQFVFIAVLLHWRKFAYSLGAPRASQKRPCRFHGKTLRPWRSFPHGRRIADHLREGNRCALVDWKPPRSCRSVRARFHPGAACSLATRLSPEEGLLLDHRRVHRPRAIQRGRALQLWVPFQQPAHSLRISPVLSVSVQPSSPLFSVQRAWAMRASRMPLAWPVPRTRWSRPWPELAQRAWPAVARPCSWRPERRYSPCRLRA